LIKEGYSFTAEAVSEKALFESKRMKHARVSKEITTGEGNRSGVRRDFERGNRNQKARVGWSQS
jgi:hypothetical protein